MPNALVLMPDVWPPLSCDRGAPAAQRLLPTPGRTRCEPRLFPHPNPHPTIISNATTIIITSPSAITTTTTTTTRVSVGAQFLSEKSYCGVEPLGQRDAHRACLKLGKAALESYTLFLQVGAALCRGPRGSRLVVYPLLTVVYPLPCRWAPPFAAALGAAD